MQFLRTRLVIGLLGLLSIGVNSTPRPQVGQYPNDKDFIKPEAIQGCYDLRTLNWKPDLQLDKDEAVFITPPERIELLAERGTEGREKKAT